MIKATHLCWCGHEAWGHTNGAFVDKDEMKDLEEVIKNSTEYGKCGRCCERKGTCEKYQLPNLDLIEYLAKQRGLI